jgi:hypothetical protein
MHSKEERIVRSVPDPVPARKDSGVKKDLIAINALLQIIDTRASFHSSMLSVPLFSGTIAGRVIGVRKMEKPDRDVSCASL